MAVHVFGPIDPNIGLQFWTVIGASPPSSVANAVLTNNGDTSRITRGFNTTGSAVCSGAWDVPLPADGFIVSTLISTYVGRVTAAGADPGKNTHALLHIGGVNYTQSGTEPWSSTSYVTRTRQWLTSPITGQGWRLDELHDIQGHGVNKTESVMGIGTVNLTQWFLTATLVEEPRKTITGRPVALVSPYGRMVVLPDEVP